MGESILKSVSFENLTSFADQVEFSTMIDAGKKENGGTTFAVGDKEYTKVSVLYGANGSGKTFFCKAIKEIQRLLLWSPLSMADSTQRHAIPGLDAMDVPVKTFAFDKSYEDKVTNFGIEVVLDGVVYNYRFSLLGKLVVAEYLTKKNRRTQVLLTRTSPAFKDIAVQSDFKDFDGLKHVVKEESLSLPIIAMLNNPIASQIMKAITEIKVVNMANRLPPVITERAFSEKRLEAYVNILRRADPTLRKIAVSMESKEIDPPKSVDDDFERRTLTKKETMVSIDSMHAVFEHGIETCSTPIDFFKDESLGTIKLFTALPYLFDILEDGGVLVIDEIENGLHLALVKEIIALFNDETINTKHAQLICTSHQPLLVDSGFRRDQVWVVSKDDYGKSSLHRMSRLKTSRAKVNLTSKLIDGAFGCNPDPFFDNGI